MSLRADAFRRAATLAYRSGATGILARLAAHARRAPAFPVLIYHRVNDDRDPFFPSLPTEVFERQVAYLARTHQVLTVEELVERMRGGGVPRNAVALTFDDGYRDNLTHAAPVLARHGVPATVFLATGFIGTTAVPAWDRVGRAFKLAPRQAWDSPWGETLVLGSTARRVSAMRRALDHLGRVPGDEFPGHLDALEMALGVTDQPPQKNPMLTWDDVHALRGLGWSVGAHTVNHLILSRVTPRRAWEEITESRAAIEAATGTAPRAFAYPVGGAEHYTDTVKQQAREAGFTCAVTTRFGLNTPISDPWELRRGGPWEHHLPSFALRLAWYRLGRA